MTMENSPNIILLVGEDSGYHLSCDGCPAVQTPHLDGLVSAGTLFRNNFATAPVCAPSRSSLVTGRYPWSLGTHNMRSQRCEPPHTFMECLREVGYYVSWPTKLDFNFEPNADFCDDSEPWEERLENGALRGPFLLYRNFAVTHESGMWEHAGKGPGDGASQRDELFSPYPDLGRCDPASVEVPPYLPDCPEVRADLARFYDTVRLHDRQVGEVLASLDHSPYAENTIVLYTSDHGRGLFREKRWPYPSGVRVPLIARGPGIEAGVRSEHLVSGVDLAPTILSLCGVSVPSEMEGVAVLGNESSPPRHYAVSGRDRMDEVFDRVRTVTDGTFFYIANEFPQLPYAARLSYMERQATTQALRREHAAGRLPPVPARWMAEDKPPEELYDLRADPWCVENLAQVEEHASKLREMRDQLARHREEIRDLGLVSERELEATGLLRKGNLDQYAKRTESLPPDLRIGRAHAPLVVDEV